VSASTGSSAIASASPPRSATSPICGYSRGRYEEAEPLASESFANAAEQPDGLVLTISILAHVALRRGDVDEATRLFSDSLRQSHELGYQHMIAFCLDGIAAVSAAVGEHERAARLFGAADVRRRELGMEHDEGAELAAPARTEAANHLGADAFRTACGDGEAMSVDDAVAYAVHGSA